MSNSSSSFSSSSTQTDTMSGGAVRVSFGVPEADAPVSAPAAVRVGNKALRWTAGGAVEQPGGLVKHVHHANGDTGGSVMATRQRVNGQETVLLEPGNPGSRVQLAFALSEGLIREAAPGIYEDLKAADGTQRTMHTVEAEQRAQQAAQQEQAQQAGAGVFNDAEDQAYAADMADVPEHAYATSTAMLIQATALGQSSEIAVQALARDAGIDPTQAAERIANSEFYFGQMVTRAALSQGVPEGQVQAFWEHALGNPGPLTNALHFLVRSRDASRMQALAAAWIGRGKA
jgi:hypothetical protein